MKRRITRLILLLSTALLTSSPILVIGQDTTVVLELNTPIERELAGGQLHKYSRPVAANQYLRIVARQQGVDIALTFRDSTGKKVIDAHDHFGSLTGVETIALVTTDAGNCSFEVSAVQKTAAPGRYTIELVDFRSPTDKDQLAAQAEIQYEIAAAAYGKKTAASYAEAIEKFSAAIDLYRRAGDRRGEAQALDYLSQCYQQTGEKNKFGALREQSLPIWRELKDPKGEALTLNAIGTFHLQAGNNEAGLEYFRKAIEIYKSLAQSFGYPVLNRAKRSPTQTACIISMKSRPTGFTP